MKVDKHKIKFTDCGWFKNKEPLILAAKNAREREQRLIWLSTGTLHYHLKDKNIISGTNGECPNEKQLFAQFIKHLAYQGTLRRVED